MKGWWTTGSNASFAGLGKEAAQLEESGSAFKELHSRKCRFRADPARRGAQLSRLRNNVMMIALVKSMNAPTSGATRKATGAGP